MGLDLAVLASAFIFGTADLWSKGRRWEAAVYLFAGVFLGISSLLADVK